MKRIEQIMNVFCNTVAILCFFLLLFAVTSPALYAWKNENEVSLSFFLTSTFICAFFYTIFPYLYCKFLLRNNAV